MAGGGEMGPGWEEEKPEFLLYIKKKIVFRERESERKVLNLFPTHCFEC